jgi:hypothetical protein
MRSVLLAIGPEDRSYLFKRVRQVAVSEMDSLKKL